MRPDDLDAVDEIERHSFKTPWAASVFAEELTREWARVDVARDDGRVVAFADYWLVKDEIHILAIATHPDRRRRGVGRALLDHVIALGRGGDYTLVTLEVRASNRPAIALYEAAGFARVGVRPRYYAEDDEDALVMTLTLR
ncbi:MAG: ribosomal protein S18-alanine N-acetyltransferase [Kofleriaceae bacterium]|nr:ribosomal protein S18-alanine N-acetyltransferase [Myxococcales bacterium]MCB9563515.1 ribosomal protein S18-alanine N-acetyltransferase [Kofleriaceae bacterium]